MRASLFLCCALLTGCGGAMGGDDDQQAPASEQDSRANSDSEPESEPESDSDSDSALDSATDTALSDSALPDTAPTDTAASCPPTLKPGGEIKIAVDAFTGNEATTEPKVDKNDGKSGDNVAFRRNNVARAHFYMEGYWYTSKHQEAGEPNPKGPQWVDYVPNLAKLGAGRYRVFIKYRAGENRAPYPAKYTITHRTGTSVVTRDQHLGGNGIIELEVGTFDFGCDGFVRAEDTGADSISFGAARFVYVGP